MLQRKCSTVKRKCSSEEVQCRGSAVQGVAGGGEMGLWGKGRNTELVCIYYRSTTSRTRILRTGRGPEASVVS